MAASVSSEHAFSQGGITVTKWRNWLKGKIVEALQCVKCAIWHDLLYQEPGPSSILEANSDDDGQYSDDEDESEIVGWDNLLLKDEGDDIALTVGMDTESD